MNKSLLLASVIAVAALAACGKKEEAPVAPAPAPIATPAPEASAPAMPAASDAMPAASAASQ